MSSPRIETDDCSCSTAVIHDVEECAAKDPPMNHPARSRATGRVTLADVASAAGVSPMTVSRALKRERAVAPDLIARVDAAIQALGYVPDPAARALASGQGSHVAVLIPLLSNALFVDLLEALQLRLRRAGYQTLIGVTHYDAEEEEQLLKEQLAHRPAGLIVTRVRPQRKQASIDRPKRDSLCACDGNVGCAGHLQRGSLANRSWRSSHASSSRTRSKTDCICRRSA